MVLKTVLSLDFHNSYMLRLISIYDRIQAAHERCIGIGLELQALPDVEYAPKETRSLNQEYIWTAGLIVRMCDELLETKPDDEYGEEVDFRIDIDKFRNKYEDILETLK